MTDGRPRPLAWGGVGVAAVVGALVIPSGPPGVGVVLTGAAIAAAVGYARPRPLDVESATFTAAALVLLSMATVLDAEWVIAVDVAAAAACSAFAVTGIRRWATLVAAPLCVAADAFRVPAAVLRALPSPRAVPWIGPAGRAAAASIVLLATFGLLFSSADAAFAQLAETVLFPEVGLDLLPARILVGLAIAGGAGGLILVAERREADAAASGEPRSVSRLEWALPLLTLDGLFAAFVVVQLAVLFGGHDHVLETAGLTYAQYARAGFFQLVVIAALVLGVVALAVRAAGGLRDPLLKVLLGVLCLLTLVVLASALRRMELYEEAYGLTRIRISVYAVDLWLGGIFVAVMTAGIVRRSEWLPRAVVALSVAGLLLFNLSDPDARIARSAVARFERTGELDTYYVSTLSADALPALAELPPDVRGCVLGPVRETDPGPWTSFNLSRQAAARLAIPEETPCSY